MFKKSFSSSLKVFTRYCHHLFAQSMPPSPPCQHAVLCNGVRLIAEQTCSPLTCITLLVEAGPRFEVACNNGVTHFIEHMADKGVKACPPIGRNEFYKMFQDMGAKMTINTSREIQEFTVTCPPESARCVMSLLAHVVSELDPSQEDIQREQEMAYNELTDLEKDPEAVMFDYLHQSAFQGTPLAQRVIGPITNICNFTPQFVNTYLTEHYQPYRLVLAVSGSLSIDYVMKTADICFGTLLPTSTVQEYGPCRYTGSSITYRDDSMPFAHVAIAVEAPGYPTRGYLEMKLLKYVIGGWNQSMGGGYNAWPELAQASAVSHISDSYRSFYFAYRDVGLWGVYCVARSLDLDDMLWSVQARWMHLCTSIQQADLDRARAAYKLELARNVDGSIQSCADMGLQMMYKCSRSSLGDSYEALSNITVDNLRATAEHHLFDRCPVVVGVGPTEGLPEYTRLRARMYWLRL